MAMATPGSLTTAQASRSTTTAMATSGSPTTAIATPVTTAQVSGSTTTVIAPPIVVTSAGNHTTNTTRRSLPTHFSNPAVKITTVISFANINRPGVTVIAPRVDGYQGLDRHFQQIHRSLVQTFWHPSTPILLSGMFSHEHPPSTLRRETPHSELQKRWRPTETQKQIMKQMYENEGGRVPSLEEASQIAAQLQQGGPITAQNVYYWFRNHKLRENQASTQGTAIAVASRSESEALSLFPLQAGDLTRRSLPPTKKHHE